MGGAVEGVLMKTVTWLSALGLMLATAGCTYSDMGVGKGGNISAEQNARSLNRKGTATSRALVSTCGGGFAVRRS